MHRGHESIAGGWGRETESCVHGVVFVETDFRGKKSKLRAQIAESTQQSGKQPNLLEPGTIALSFAGNILLIISLIVSLVTPIIFEQVTTPVASTAAAVLLALGAANIAVPVPVIAAVVGYAVLGSIYLPSIIAHETTVYSDLTDAPGSFSNAEFGQDCNRNRNRNRLSFSLLVFRFSFLICSSLMVPYNRRYCAYNLDTFMEKSVKFGVSFWVACAGAICVWLGAASSIFWLVKRDVNERGERLLR